MLSMQHHYGVGLEHKSTPIWPVASRAFFGAIRTMPVLNRIAELREAKGWKRPELAKRAGTSPQQIERLEKAQRRLSDVWIERLANALEVSPHEIIADLTLPSEAELEQMLAIAFDELSPNATIADSKRAVASSLRAQLERYRAADEAHADAESLAEVESGVGTGVQSPAATRRGGRAGSRTS